MTAPARTQGRRVLRALLGVLFGSGFAAGAVLADSQVALHVRTVLANDEGSAFDSRLAQCRKQLQNLFHFSSYRLVKEEQREVEFGSPHSFEIPGGRFLEVLPVGYKEERVKLNVVLIEGAKPHLDTDFSVPNHGSIWVGGPRHPDGTLLISIGAEALP